MSKIFLYKISLSQIFLHLIKKQGQVLIVRTVSKLSNPSSSIYSMVISALGDGGYSHTLPIRVCVPPNGVVIWKLLI